MDDGCGIEQIVFTHTQHHRQTVVQYRQKTDIK